MGEDSCHVRATQVVARDEATKSYPFVACRLGISADCYEKETHDREKSMFSGKKLGR
jgi:hypothetical protein